MKMSNQNRYGVIQAVVLLASLLLLGKAMQIQLFDPSYKKRAEAIAIGTEVQYPSRGLIYDRKGKLLVQNKPIYDLMVTYNQVDPKMDTLAFCELLGIDKHSFEERLNKDFRNIRYSKRKAFVFMSKLSAATYARLQEHLYRFPGFEVQLRNVRSYPHRNAAHVLGFISEVSQSQIDASKGKYKRADYIGATGLERQYEDVLRGKKGVRHVFKNNLGKVVSSYANGEKDSMAVSGKDLITTLDLDLQTYGELLMQNKAGSIVAIEPATGEILCMLSSTSYDPNMLSIHRNRGVAFNQLLHDTLRRPLLDRSIKAKYPPGSIFKTVVALIAMQEGVLRPNQGFVCNGGYYYKGAEKPRGCHFHPYPYNVSIALMHSCNTYFFHTIRNIIEIKDYYHPEPGLDLFDKYLYDFGLGKPLGIDIPNEGSGNVPTVEYYDHLYRNSGGWKSPTIMSIGIGQGEIEMTTVQMANLAAIIANRGFYYTPHLIKGFRDSKELIPQRFRQKHKVPIGKEYFDPVVRGMEMAVTGGTGRAAAITDISVCGKTGTSQNPHGKDHSVFFAFAPKDNPKIAIAVYVEHGVWGSDYAAPIAGLMMEKYLKGQISESKKDLEAKMIEANLIENP
ncbi:MAG TPA: penicillin-binding protein 2 [Phaeodactylibacter sp.]|nr:penicillin-binding protein 2 [Phaeodactylibacter sp.]